MTTELTEGTRPILLVGISNPATTERLVALAGDLAGQMGADILLTHVVTVASQISLTTGSSSGEVVRARDFVQEVISAARASGISARGLVEVARSVEDGLLSAAESHGAETMLVGYSEEGSEGDEASPDEARFDRTIHRVARKARADVVVAKLRRASHRRIAVPLAPDTPLGLTGLVCAALRAEDAAELTFLHVAESAGAADDARRELTARLEAAGLLGLGSLDVRTAPDVSEAVVEAVADHDLVVLTPADRPGLLDRVYSSRAEKMAESVSASAILAWGSADVQRP